MCSSRGALPVSEERLLSFALSYNFLSFYANGTRSLSSGGALFEDTQHTATNTIAGEM